MKDSSSRIVFYSVAGTIIILLAMIAIPNFVKARTTTSRLSCPSILQMLNSATQQWAIENRATNGQPVAVTNLVKYLSYPYVPHCPDGGVIQVGKVGEAPHCNLPGHRL